MEHEICRIWEEVWEEKVKKMEESFRCRWIIKRSRNNCFSTDFQWYDKESMNLEVLLASLSKTYIS